MKYPEALNPQTMLPVRILHANKLSADVQLKAVSTARMELPIDDVVSFDEWVKIYYPNGKFGIYRASTPETDYKAGKHTVTLDHGVCTLGDSIVNVGDTKDENDVAQTTYFEGTPTQVFTRLLTYQKRQYWQLGTCEATGQIKVEIDYPKLLTVMNDTMTQLPDYYLEYDQASFPWTVNIRRFPTVVKAEGRLSRNINSVSIRYQDNEFYTRVYCEALTNKYLDSEKINNYRDIREYHYYLSDDVTNESALKICRQFLKEHDVPKVTVDIDGADFSKVTGEPLDRFVLGDVYRLAITERNVLVEEQITRIRYIDLINNEYELNLTLAREREDISSLLAKTANKAAKNAKASAKSKGTVYHVYEKLKKHGTAITDYGEVLREAGLEFDENHVLIFATEAGKDSALGSTFNVTKSGILSEVYAEDDKLKKGLRSEISQTATAIRGEVRDEFLNVNGRLDIQSTKVGLLVGGTDENPTIKAAGIWAEIADDMRTTHTKIAADVITFDGDAIATSLETKDMMVASLTAASLEATEGISCLGDLSVAGDLQVSGNPVVVSDITFNSAKTQMTVSYTDGRADATFSKAVASVTWTWSNGRAKVTLSPQGQSFYSPSIDSWTVRGNPSASGSTVSQDINIVDEDGNTVTILNISVNASTVENPINIPENYIYTTSGSHPSGAVNATTMKSRILQAIADSEKLVFRVDCGGSRKYYYMDF